MVKIGKKRRLDELDPLFRYERSRIPSDLIGKKLEEALNVLAEQCRDYINTVTTNVGNHVTELDKEKAKLCTREMEAIENLAKTLFNFKAKKKCYRKTQKLHTRIALLEDYPQDCWPDVLITMLYNGKKVATKLIESEEVVYSEKLDEMGLMCGKIRTISFETPLKLQTLSKSVYACKVELLMWLGLRKELTSCLSSLSNVFMQPLQPAEIPKHLTLSEKHNFQCRCHVYQGKFRFGADVTGLSDYYIRIMLNETSACTQIIKRKLNPLWDESVFIPHIVLYGSRSFIKENPPTCIAEVIDYDDKMSSAYVGRVLLKPIVKLRTDPYAKPEFPPPLKWYNVVQKNENVGRVLMCVELLEITSAEALKVSSSMETMRIPEDIRPVLCDYKVDILFWGVRQLKKVRGIQVNRPNIVVDFTFSNTQSEITTSKFPNFDPKLKTLSIQLPVERDYIPPLTFQLQENIAFAHIYVANHITNIDRFLHYPITSEERQVSLLQADTKSYDSMESKDEQQLVIKKRLPLKLNKENIGDAKSKLVDKLEEARQKVKENMTKEKRRTLWKALWAFVKKKRRKILGRDNPQDKSKKGKAKTKNIEKENEMQKNLERSKSAVVEITPDLEEEFTIDWWTKFFSSVESLSDFSKPEDSDIQNKNFKLKIYEEELEYQPEFNGFQDTFVTFPLIRGEQNENEKIDQKHIMGTFKGNLKIYPWPPRRGVEYVSPSGKNLVDGFFQDAPSNDNVSFIARVYCVRAEKLRPQDVFGTTDAFLVAFMGDQHFSTAKEYIPKQVNPIFGKSFEFMGMFPKNHILTIQIWDYDMHTSHDLVGETTIDLENRYYTRHRARCGIAYEYQEKGANVWRDDKPPTAILSKLCQRYNLDAPKYYDTYAMIGQMIFPITVSEGEVTKPKYTEEELALDLLHKWHKVPVVGCHLVPEHVETRSLYNPRQPGLEQGKLQMWVDIFPTSDLPPPPPVEITPRKAQRYELRVVILNTEDVILTEDDFFSGEKKSDIFIKGWVPGIDEIQYTDVHYRSLNGEGNFNWRFVFPFTYLKTENKLVVVKNQMFHSMQAEKKLPCRLKLQVWDNDTFSMNDFLGSLTLNLACMPRGANSARLCTLKILDRNAPQINLFKLKRTKGWWPFEGVDEHNQRALVGKLEAEFEIVSGDEADSKPVGRGRSEPYPLPFPKRPDTSFSFFKNPFKLIKFLICKQYKWKIIRLVLLLFLCALVVVFFWHFPRYLMKKILHA